MEDRTFTKIKSISVETISFKLCMRMISYFNFVFPFVLMIGKTEVFRKRIGRQKKKDIEKIDNNGLTDFKLLLVILFQEII